MDECVRILFRKRAEWVGCFENNDDKNGLLYVVC